MEPLTIKTPYAVIKQHTPDHVMTAGSKPHAMGKKYSLYPPEQVMSPSPRTIMKK
jgi:hypothetical protein